MQFLQCRLAFSESEKIRFNHECRLNIAYGPTFREKLDIYGDNLEADSPIFVWVHGGYWQMLDKWMSAYVVAPLVEKGIRVIIIGYELCPTVTLEQLVAQTEKAFQWISNYVAKNSINSVSLSGHSAGAQIVAKALTKPFVESFAEDVKMFTYFISGVFDLSELRNLRGEGENHTLGLTDENIIPLSPQFQNFQHLKDRNIKIYVYVGDHESEKFKQQSKDFVEIPLKGLPSVTLAVINGVDHFNIVEKLSERDFDITKMIVQNAFPSMKQQN